MSKNLENELDHLKRKLLTLRAAVEENVAKAVQAVGLRDPELTQEVVKHDQWIDMEEVKIEEECLKILALHQPVAIDLRFVISVLKINNDLERIGDLAVNIAERAYYLAHEAPVEYPFDFEEMEKRTRKMIQKALDAFIERNAHKAYEVCQEDNEVDRIYREMYKQVSEQIKKTPGQVDSLIAFLSISRHLERMADYATNIAEDTMYMIDGLIVRHHADHLVRS